MHADLSFSYLRFAEAASFDKKELRRSYTNINKKNQIFDRNPKPHGTYIITTDRFSFFFISEIAAKIAFLFNINILYDCSIINNEISKISGISGHLKGRPEIYPVFVLQARCNTYGVWQSTL
jgi:hypothetical protein